MTRRERSRPSAPAAAALALVTGLVAGLAGCGPDEFEDRTAVVALGGSSETYEVDSCGLDGQTVFLVARAASGAALQAVVGLEADDATGIPGSTGATVDVDATSAQTRVAAFGAEAWERREGDGPSPGSITSARVRGSRIQLAGTAVPVDAGDRPITGGKATPLSIDARCDLQED